jgi:hypothetical protein
MALTGQMSCSIVILPIYRNGDKTNFTSYQHHSQSLTPCVIFCNKLIFGGESLTPFPTPKLEDHTLSAACDCLCSIFTVILHIWKPYQHHTKFYSTFFWQSELNMYMKLLRIIYVDSAVTTDKIFSIHQIRKLKIHSLTHSKTIKSIQKVIRLYRTSCFRGEVVILARNVCWQH